MPRTVSSKVRIALPAHEAWRARCDFALEQHIAALGKRKLELIEEEVTNEGATDEQRQRLVRCDLLGDQLNGGVMGVKTADLNSEVLSVFFVNLFDEAHGAEFSVDMAMRRLNVSITGHQWCLIESDTSCFLCTRIQLEVKLVGIGGLVEMQLERQMRASHAAFPEHACAFARRRTVQRRVDSVEVLPTVPEEPARSMAMATADPQLNRWRLVSALLLQWALRWPRRHRPLAAAVPVRVHRRHARVLLLCGCADAVVDSDEIVE